ncbi:hypothetical protein MNEG_3444 [Monoraphidium neglectum]|uniref:Uncharacterized protein n=1 Tax=Monoraphidium neglectum TaxID=145388 RepID=A0A0D2MVI1_9CHLO|nr:hypothetical protein MNEG_3444 [Monoraphidium neglectum]KIZ04507.1 hypothetical protein MNEG_3444 [Monoraphidium neglectum]|eukprot:XP_013903526.1 hypothetical protein MNEG_3444 [Monoraphidium neglectum]
MEEGEDEGMASGGEGSGQDGGAEASGTAGGAGNGGGAAAGGAGVRRQGVDEELADMADALLLLHEGA